MKKVGDKIYVPTSMSISNGSSDVQGGLCTIEKITYSDHLPEDHCNYCFVEVEELPGHSYNYKNLMERQDELKEQFGSLERRTYLVRR